MISRQIVGTNIAGEAQDALESFGLPVLEGRTAQRVAYAEAAGTGRSVIDESPNSKAASEMKQITADVLTLLNTKPVSTNGTPQ